MFRGPLARRRHGAAARLVSMLRNHMLRNQLKLALLLLALVISFSLFTRRNSLACQTPRRQPASLERQLKRSGKNFWTPAPAIRKGLAVCVRESAQRLASLAIKIRARRRSAALVNFAKHAPQANYLHWGSVKV